MCVELWWNADQQEQHHKPAVLEPHSPPLILTFSHPELDPRLRSENSAPSCLSNGTVSFLLHAYLSIPKDETYYSLLGARGSVVVKALCYKPEGRGFNTR
jgi:hypothetical protein